MVGKYGELRCLWQREHVVDAIHITEVYDAENKAEIIIWAYKTHMGVIPGLPAMLHLPEAPELPQIASLVGE